MTIMIDIKLRLVLYEHFVGEAIQKINSFIIVNEKRVIKAGESEELALSFSAMREPKASTNFSSLILLFRKLTK